MRMNAGFHYSVPVAWRTPQKTMIPQGGNLPPKIIEEPVVTFRQVTLNVLLNAVRQKHPAPKGVESRVESKEWSRILRDVSRTTEKDDKGEEKGDGWFNLSLAGYDFLLKTLEPFGCEGYELVVKEEIIENMEAAKKLEDEQKAAAQNGVAKPEAAKV